MYHITYIFQIIVGAKYYVFCNFGLQGGEGLCLSVSVAILSVENVAILSMDEHVAILSVDEQV